MNYVEFMNLVTDEYGERACSVWDAALGAGLKVWAFGEYSDFLSSVVQVEEGPVVFPHGWTGKWDVSIWTWQDLVDYTNFYAYPVYVVQ